MIDMSVHSFQMFLMKILVAWCLQLWSSWSFLVTIPCKNFANCKQTTAIVLEIVAWILFTNQRIFPKPFFNSQSLVWWSHSLAWKVGSWRKLQSIAQHLPNITVWILTPCAAWQWKVSTWSRSSHIFIAFNSDLSLLKSLE